MARLHEDEQRDPVLGKFILKGGQRVDVEEPLPLSERLDEKTRVAILTAFKSQICGVCKERPATRVKGGMQKRQKGSKVTYVCIHCFVGQKSKSMQEERKPRIFRVVEDAF